VREETVEYVGTHRDFAEVPVEKSSDERMELEVTLIDRCEETNSGTFAQNVSGVAAQ